MPSYDVTNPIVAYSTHFFPREAAIPVFIMVYKNPPTTFDDVAGYLMFTDQPPTGNFRDNISPVSSYIVKHFPIAQLGEIQTLLRHRLDYLKQPMSIHYVGDHAVGGWTTLDAGASPGLDPALIPLVTARSAKAAPTPPAEAKSGNAKSGGRKKAAKK
jgi:hypothetical protein